MDVNKVWGQLQTLPGLLYKVSKGDNDSIILLDSLSKLLFQEPVKKDCSNCHIKAYHRLSNITYQKLIEMNEQKFKIKKGVTIEFPVNSGRYLSAANMTDELARDYLINHADGVKHFDAYPQDHEGKLKLFPSAEELNQIAVNEAGAEDGEDLSKLKNDDLKAMYKELTGEEIEGKKSELIAAIEQFKADQAEKEEAALRLTELRAKYLEKTGDEAPEEMAEEELIAAIEAE